MTPNVISDKKNPQKTILFFVKVSLWTYLVKIEYKQIADV